MMIKKVFKNFGEVSNFLREERFDLYTLIISKIGDCLITGCENTLIAEFFLTDDEIIFKIEMDKKHWHETLNLALNYFEDVEEYEKCREITNLITELYG